MGVRADGTKELIAMADGYRESSESWAGLLRDCRRRGVRAPVRAVGDGALGFWNAINEVFSEARHQRCWVHKAANCLDSHRKRSNAIFCSTDWTEGHHDIALVDQYGSQLAKLRISDDSAGFHELMELLVRHGDTAENPIPVAIETPRGLLVAGLRATGRKVYAINPLATACYRDRGSVSRAKSDAADARVTSSPTSRGCQCCPEPITPATPGSSHRDIVPRRQASPPQRNSWTTWISPTMWALKSSRSSAGTQSSRIVCPPACWMGYRLKNSDSTSKRVTNPAPSCFTFQSRAILTA